MVSSISSDRSSPVPRSLTTILNRSEPFVSVLYASREPSLLTDTEPRLKYSRSLASAGSSSIVCASAVGPSLASCPSADQRCHTRYWPSSS